MSIEMRLTAEPEAIAEMEGHCPDEAGAALIPDENHWAHGILMQSCTEESKRNLQTSLDEFFAKATPHEQQALDEARKSFYQIVKSTQAAHDARYPEQAPGSKKSLSQKFRAGWNKSSEVAYEYTQHLDVMMGQAPEYVGLAFGAIKIILTVQVNDQELKQGVEKHLNQIKNSFAPIDTITSFIPTTSLLAAVAEAYSHFLRFLERAIKHYTASKWKRPLKAFTNPWKLEFQGIVGDIQESVAFIQKIVQVHHLAVSHRNFELAEQTVERVSSMEKNLDILAKTLRGWPSAAFHNTREIQQTRDLLQQHIDEKQDLPFQLQAALTDDVTAQKSNRADSSAPFDINESDFLTRFRDAVFPDLRTLEEDLAKREKSIEQLPEMEAYRGKRDSILRLEKVLAWLESEHSELLWINGNHVLKRSDWNTSFVMPLLIDGRGSYESITVLQYFCGDLGSSTTNNCRTLLQALIFEILEKHPQVFEMKHIDFSKGRFAAAATDVSRLWQLFIDCLVEIKSGCIFIIIDSIDNLQTTVGKDGVKDSDIFVQGLNTLVKDKARLIKILLTARLAQGTMTASAGADAALIVPQRKLSHSIVQDQLPLLNHKLAEIQEGRGKYVTFADMYLLYPLKTIIFIVQDGNLRAYVVAELSGMQEQQIGRFEPLQIRAWHIEHNGKYFTRRYSNFAIPMFSGSRAVTSLRYIPAGYLPRENQSRAKLIARGKLFWELCGKVHFKQFHSRNGGSPVSVVVDQRSLPSEAVKENIQDIDNQVISKSFHSLRLLMFLVCPTGLIVYNLRDAFWMDVNIENLQPQKYPIEDWDAIVIPQEIRGTMLKSIRQYSIESATTQQPGETQSSTSTSAETGLRILLHGPAGTGKSLTIAAVANKVARPLMISSLGKLCSDFQHMEGTLQRHFDNARSWKAIVHFREVDILTRPSKVDDAERLKALSVFCRKLEQFDGICFMTTSRSAVFDEVFKPLLSLTFQIPTPNLSERQEIWRLHLYRAGKQGMHLETGLLAVAQDVYSKSPLTGKRIANCVSGAVLLAKAESSEELQQSHVERVLALTTDFDTYLRDTRGLEPLEAERAREEEEKQRKKQEKEDLEKAQALRRQRNKDAEESSSRYS